MTHSRLPSSASPPSSRRSFLRGGGVSLALPFLPSALPRSAWATTDLGLVPKRFLTYFTPCGHSMDRFHPTAVGTDFVLTEVLASLESVRHELLIPSGLSVRSGLWSQYTAYPHDCGTASLFTDIEVHPENEAIKNGISIDQVIANAIGSATPFPSLQLGAHLTGIDCTFYTCVYQHNTSWASESTPLQPLLDPVIAFERLFGAADNSLTEEQVVARRSVRISVLDLVLDRANALSGRLGKSDQTKLDQYLTSVRELEQQIDALASAQCTPSFEVTFEPDRFEHNVGVLMDLLVLAFECDLTRVGSFMVGPGGALQAYPFIGYDVAHHTISHLTGVDDPVSALAEIGAWNIEQLSLFAQKLEDRLDTDGNTLLHNSVIVAGSELSSPEIHSFDDMPFVVLGSGGGALPTGRHTRFPAGTPHSNMFLNILDAFDIEAETFGEYGTERLDLEG